MLPKHRCQNRDHPSKSKAQRLMETAHNRSTRPRMEIITIVISLACLSHGALADDQATPSPTPVYLNRLARPGSLRRHEQINRSRALQTAAESNAQARAEAKANRQSTATAQAQAREAARAREQAQRQVAAQNRFEARNETPHPTSDVMRRMGFSEQEIAAQKAREHSANSGAKQTTATTSQSGHQQEQPKPAVDSGAVGDRPAPSPARP